MPEWLKQEVLYQYSVPFFVLFIAAEVIFSSAMQLRLYQTKDTLTSVVFALCNISLDMLMKLVSFGVLTWAYSHRVFEMSNPWLYWGLLVLLQDFAYYVQHYMDHRVRLLWAVHVTHHNSMYFNLSTGFRSSVFQPLYRFVYFVPIALLGFTPLHIMFVYAATQIYGNLIHTRVVDKMGFLEKILVTPSHHRVHHASNVPYLDKNMGMLFIFWDKAFGTFTPEGTDVQPIHYGLVHDVEKRYVANLIFHEFKSIVQDVRQANLTWYQRAKYIFGPPGWSHDGHKQTSKQMQAQWLARL
ncbi:sterol desaturase family protein [Hydromonas duriensis]|uniref:Sterol desaturase/sphingolipid hydroxylase (Fatty acid hydroxylase superfamily) n=1 Tax=Hydromonas duriensis TaxID=1527608 RepID=A0A4R6Y8T3_9BURK|nr:sterol desaturase family protein [Hydromonas duriensis]TDR31835.1 sterol desaturase/sphingolipid hydroxylase (fatty acid hydroxylase superfamily) [Hydromonas duriensis]